MLSVDRMVDQMKLDIVNLYAFNMAVRILGYVTKKPLDAFVPDSIPHSKHLKTLIPHPKAVIFVDDFPDRSDLSKYLQYLLSN